MPTHIEITTAGGGGIGGNMAIEGGVILSETITPTGSNQVTSMAAPTAGGQRFVTIVADEAIFVAIGATPNATVNPRRALSAGQARSFTIGAGDKVAVVTR
jgi:hypothetical protein